MAKFIIGIVIGVFVIVFMVQNVETVDIQFLTWTFQIQRAIMILIVFVVGIGIGWVVKSIGYMKKRKKQEREGEEGEKVE